VWVDDYDLEGVVWVDPTDLSIYLDVDQSIDDIAFQAALKRDLFMDLSYWAERWANVQQWEYVPLRKLFRYYTSSKYRSINSIDETLDMFEHYLENDNKTPDALYQTYQRPQQDADLLAYLRRTPYYSMLLDQIEADSYHMAVRQAMDAIVTRYDHDVE
jgi:hypothetical protein